MVFPWQTMELFQEGVYEELTGDFWWNSSFAGLTIDDQTDEMEKSSSMMIWC